MTLESSYTCTMHFSRARLRGHRDGLGLTHAEVADRLGVAAQLIWDTEAGVTAFTHDLAERLAGALGVALADLEYRSGRSYAEEYLDANLTHARPLSTDDIARAAQALRPHTTEAA